MVWLCVYRICQVIDIRCCCYRSTFTGTVITRCVDACYCSWWFSVDTGSTADKRHQTLGTDASCTAALCSVHLIDIIAGDVFSSGADRRPTCSVSYANCAIPVCISVITTDHRSSGVDAFIELRCTVLHRTWTNDVGSGAACASTCPVSSSDASCRRSASQPSVRCRQCFWCFIVVHGA